jgi:hypothetical protein
MWRRFAFPHHALFTFEFACPIALDIAMPNSYRSWLMTLVALAILVFMGQHCFQVARNAISRPESSDFFKFVVSAQRLDQGFSMYWLVPPKLRQGDPCHRDTPEQAVHFEDSKPSLMNLGGPQPCLGPNLNPPVFMVFMRPLLALPYGQAWWTWASVSSLCVVLSAWLMAGHWVRHTGTQALWTLWGSAALFLFYPTLANFTLGQVGTVLLLLMTLAWRLAHLNRLLQAGCVLGLAISLKPFLGTLLLALMLALQWRALAATLVTMMCLAGVGAWAYGLDAYLQYLQVAKNITWTASNWNGSWYGWFDRYFISKAGADWPESMGFSWQLATAFALATLMAAGAGIRTAMRKSPADTWNAVFALGLPATLLVSPLGWVYYFPILGLSGVIAWSHAQRNAPESPAKLALWIPVVMCLVPVGLQASPTPLHAADWVGMDSWFGYTLLAQFGTCLVAITRKGH